MRRSLGLEMADPSRPGDQLEYELRVRLPDGTSLRPTRFLTRRRCGLGDVVKLPVRPDGELQPGEAYDWRVAAVEEDGKLLLLEFRRPAA
jgi:hypothetical protein